MVDADSNPPEVQENDLLRAFPGLSSLVRDNDGRIPLSAAIPIVAGAMVLCISALLNDPSPALKHELEALRPIIKQLSDELKSSKSTNDAHEPELPIEVSDRISAIIKNVVKVSLVAQHSEKKAAAAALEKVPKGVPLDLARCYSYICAEGETCYAPRCPRSHVEKVPKGISFDMARCYSFICAEGETCYAPRCPRAHWQPEQLEYVDEHAASS